MRYRSFPAGFTAALLLGLTIQAAPGIDPANASTRCPWVGSSASVSARVDQLVSVMSLDQKMSMLHGAEGSTYAGFVPAIPSLCIPAINLEDGPAGVGDGLGGATQLPAPVTAAATWDTTKQTLYGKVLGAEQAGKGVTIALGPTVNLVRDPRWGRAFESTGEDPYLAGATGSLIIRGIQNQGVLAQVKHLAAYTQETNRNTTQDNVSISTRALQEIYLPAFRSAVSDAAVASVMCSYSTVNSTPACQNPYLQDTVLRGQFGFNGFITSDWHAAKSTIASATNGMNLEMPYALYYGDPLKAAVTSGDVPVSTVDSLVGPLLTEMFGFGLFDRSPSGSTVAVVSTAADVNAARTIAASGTVLLKNVGATLPITTSIHSIAVIGGGGSTNTEYSGGGSAAVSTAAGVSPLAGIKARAPAGTSVTYDSGTSASSAAARARDADLAVVFAGLPEGEGTDLTSIDLPESTNDLIDAVAAANPHTVVVLNTGSAVTMPWLSRAAAVLEAWYPGQQAGPAIADILFGDVNPSGHLPVTFPESLADVPAHTSAQWPGVDGTAHYSEGLALGYRWYDQSRITPLFPFGFGLSYTTFAYSDLAVSAMSPGGSATVSATVTNTGRRYGSDVMQLYVSDPASAGEPPQQLKGFRKVTLKAGQSARESFTVRRRDLAVWSTGSGGWTTMAGTYGVSVGDSSRTLPLAGTLAVGAGASASDVSIPTPDPVDVGAGRAFAQPIPATDSAGRILTFTATGLPNGVTIDSGGTLRGTPTTPGTVTVTVTATDTAGASESAALIFTVNPPGGAGGPLGPITGLGGLCLEARAGAGINRTAVQTATCNDTNAQQWTVRSDGTLRALGRCLDVSAGGTGNRTPVQLYDCNGTPAQQWSYRPGGSLVNPGSHRCLDVPSARTAPGSQLEIYHCNGTGAQLWSLPT